MLWKSLAGQFRGENKIHYTILIEIYISNPFNTAESLREMSGIDSATEKGGIADNLRIHMLFRCSSTAQSMFEF